MTIAVFLPSFTCTSSVLFCDCSSEINTASFPSFADSEPFFFVLFYIYVFNTVELECDLLHLLLFFINTFFFLHLLEVSN